MTVQLGVFGLTKEQILQRLPSLPVSVTVDISTEGEDSILSLTSSVPWAPEETAAAVADCLGVYCYSRDGRSLAARVVQLLQQHGMTVALAESCTGGMVAAALTDVPGCSQVFGTGVVSYSLDCKQHLLRVRKETLGAHGAVSAETAGEMARGVRRTGGATLGLSFTGEAGPQAAEAQPVGTVYVALADDGRTWVRRLDIGDRGREEIRRRATAQGLDLLRRYLEAYPTLMAGGISNMADAAASVQYRLPQLLPRRGEQRRVFWVKVTVWLAVLAILVTCGLLGYYLTRSSGNNRQLQDDLRQAYWNSIADVSASADKTDKSSDMMTQFEGLYARNADVAGWIRIADTVIDYPIMQYSDGYYRDHDFNMRFSHYGQPYFDEEDSIIAQYTPKTLTVYGNNTRDGQMFSELLSYRRIAFLQEHPIIEMNTLYETSRWEIFAVLVMDGRDSFQLRHSFSGDADFGRYISQLCSRSLYSSNHEVTEQDRLLVLCTDASKEYGHDSVQVVVAKHLAADQNESTGEVQNAQPVYKANPSGRFPDGWFTDKLEGATSTGTTATVTVTTTAAQGIETSGTDAVSTGWEPTATTTVDDATVTTTATTLTATDTGTTTATDDDTDKNGVTSQATTSTTTKSHDVTTTTKPEETEKEQYDDMRD